MKDYLLSQSQRQQVIDSTNKYIALANRLLGIELPIIEIRFDLKGKASGMFVVQRNQFYFRYNQIIFSQYFDDAVVNTVAHEVAHYVVCAKWGPGKVKPHGKEWSYVMGLFRIKPEVTSSYDISQLPLRQQRRHDYRCACMCHQLTTTRHNKVQAKKAVYYCRKCKQPLKFTES